MEQFVIDGICSKDKRHERGQETEGCSSAQRDNRKGKKPIKRESEQFAKAVLRGAGQTLSPLYRYSDLAKADPRAQTSKISLMLREAPELLKDPTGHECKITCI